MHAVQTIQLTVAFSCTSILNLYFCFCIEGSAMQDSDKPGSSVVEIQCLLDSVGATELVIDLIVNTKNDQVFEESILLGIALLQGGNTQIQVGSTLSYLKLFRVLETCVHHRAAAQPELLPQPAAQAGQL